MCIDGELKGQMYAVMEGDNKLGRSPECQIHLLDPKISRVHALISQEHGVLLLMPRSDKNPTFRNDNQIADGDQLLDNDVVRFGNIGSSSFRFRTIDPL